MTIIANPPLVPLYADSAGVDFFAAFASINGGSQPLQLASIIGYNAATVQPLVGIPEIYLEEPQNSYSHTSTTLAAYRISGFLKSTMPINPANKNPNYLLDGRRLGYGNATDMGIGSTVLADDQANATVGALSFKLGPPLVCYNPDGSTRFTATLTATGGNTGNPVCVCDAGGFVFVGTKPVVTSAPIGYWSLWKLDRTAGTLIQGYGVGVVQQSYPIALVAKNGIVGTVTP